MTIGIVVWNGEKNKKFHYKSSFMLEILKQIISLANSVKVGGGGGG